MFFLDHDCLLLVEGFLDGDFIAQMPLLFTVLQGDKQPSFSNLSAKIARLFYPCCLFVFSLFLKSPYFLHLIFFL